MRRLAGPISVLAIFFVGMLVFLTGPRGGVVNADSSETCHSIDKRGNCVSLEDIEDEAEEDGEDADDEVEEKAGLEFFSDKDLIIELRSRGYQVRRKKMKKDEKQQQLKKKKKKKERDQRAINGGGKKEARRVNDQAINAAEQGRLWDSVDMFKRAVSMDPANAEYWTNLGVSQMRASVYHSAETSFRTAISYQKTYANAHENIRVLQTYLPSKLPYKEPRPSLHRRRKFKRILASDLYTDPKYASYAAGEKPFMLIDAMKDAPGLHKWDREYFQDLFPSAYMDHYPQNMFLEHIKPRFVPIHEAFEDLVAAQSNRSKLFKDKPGVYIQWNLDYPSWNLLMSDLSTLPKIFRADDAWMNKCFRSDQTRSEWQTGTHWRMLLIGSQGAGMFGHRDILQTSSWQVQISGYKRWHVCSPAQDKFMYRAGDVDAFDPDYEKYPKFKGADCIDDVAGPGDMVFYPKAYWHQTEVWPGPGGRPSTAVTGTVIDKNNYKSVQAELVKECAPSGPKRISLSPAVCKDLEEKCYGLWEELWGGKEAHHEATSEL
mgnify:CR=1 FL=1